MASRRIVPGAEPFLLPGGKTGCLLLHGFTAMPDEMRPLGDFLAGEGYTVLGARLAGHATHPRDLARTRWTDWLTSVEDGLAMLAGITERTFLLGLSMGGMIALVAAARYPVAGVVAMSTPFAALPAWQAWLARLLHFARPMQPKSLPEKHPTLPERREAGYPAYPVVPTAVLPELSRLHQALRVVLPQVQVPALVIQSDADRAIPPDSLAEIYTRLGTADKEKLLLSGMDHAIVRDPGRQAVFVAITTFLARH